MEVATILTIVVLNIMLPTLDVFTDINLAIKLYKPQPGCVWYYSSRDGQRLSDLSDVCYKDPVTFCSHNENREHCKCYDPHPKMATVLLTPFLLNYCLLYTSDAADE